MTNQNTIALEEIIASRTGSINPAKHPDEVFDLYSIPAFDRGRPETTHGSSIGSTKQIVEPGDVLLSKIVPHIRRSWVVSQSKGNRLIASGEWIVFRSHHIHADYLRHVLISDPFHARFLSTVSGVGGSLLRARPAHVAKIKIPLPTLAEQRRIAEVLDQTEALRTKRRKSLAQLDELTQSIFLDMFGTSGTIPMEPLGDRLSFVTSGGRDWARFYTHAGKRFIRSLDVKMNYIDDSDATYVSPPDNAEARRTAVKTGDVLLTITGSRIGRVSTVPERLEGSHISQHVAILRPRQGAIRPEFLSFFLSLETEGQRQITKAQYGQTKPGLNFQQISKFKVPAVDLPLQDEFTHRVDSVERLKASHRVHLAELDALFSSLQYRAFRGEL